MAKMPAQQPGKSKQDYRTPQEFLAALCTRLAIPTFAIDLAASAENAIVPRFYDKAINSLAQSWVVDGWGWCNPEFADITPWVRKAWEESQQGAYTAVLIPAGVGSNWWRDWVHAKANVLLLNGRLCFITDWATTIDPATEKPGKGPARCYTSPPLYPKDCCLLLYGPDEPAGYEVWTWK